MGKGTAGRVVIFVDELDVVRSLPFSTDEFFAAIRECYTRRTEDLEFERLTFCLLGVATPSDLIRDTRITPFNIGRRIELNDFTAQEAAPLVSGLKVELSMTAPATLDRILYWTNGHPYLTQRLCQAKRMSWCRITSRKHRQHIDGESAGAQYKNFMNYATISSAFRSLALGSVSAAMRSSNVASIPPRRRARPNRYASVTC